MQVLEVHIPCNRHHSLFQSLGTLNLYHRMRTFNISAFSLDRFVHCAFLGVIRDLPSYREEDFSTGCQVPLRATTANDMHVV
jgi:hypothetical protein